VARPQRRRRTGARDRLRFWLISWLLLWGLYLLLVFKTEGAEIVAGAVCGAIGATGAELVRTVAAVRFAPGWGWLRGVALLPLEVAVDTVRLVVVLWRVIVRREDVRGRFVTLPFRRIRGSSTEAVSRRAVAKWVGSVSPNTLVVGFDERHGRILVHQLVPTAEPPRCDPWERPR
jgi:multisubunit Na+/H+ antiporter MnhE subunit